MSGQTRCMILLPHLHDANVGSMRSPVDGGRVSPECQAFVRIFPWRKIPMARAKDPCITFMTSLSARRVQLSTSPPLLRPHTGHLSIYLRLTAINPCHAAHAMVSGGIDRQHTAHSLSVLTFCRRVSVVLMDASVRHNLNNLWRGAWTYPNCRMSTTGIIDGFGIHSVSQTSPHRRRARCFLPHARRRLPSRYMLANALIMAEGHGSHDFSCLNPKGRRCTPRDDACPPRSANMRSISFHYLQPKLYLSSCHMDFA